MPNARSSDVTICECFARDGLQHEPSQIPTDVKVELIDLFSKVGFPRIEATSFSHPKIIPQFNDAEEVLQRIRRAEGASYKATCANMRAVERALAAADAGFGPEEISVLLSATESHTQRNLKCSRAEQWTNVEQMIRAASGRFTIVGSISVALGCPFEGEVEPSVVVEDAEKMAGLGVTHISIGDTVGTGNPKTVRALVKSLKNALPDTVFIAHFHDTRGSGLANCIAALEAGLTHFDSALGGVGGHPASIEYGQGDTGNCSTEDLVFLLQSMGVSTGLDLDALLAASRKCEEALGRTLNSRIARSFTKPSTDGVAQPSGVDYTTPRL